MDLEDAKTPMWTEIVHLKTSPLVVYGSITHKLLLSYVKSYSDQTKNIKCSHSFISSSRNADVFIIRLGLVLITYSKI